MIIETQEDLLAIKNLLRATSRALKEVSLIHAALHVDVAILELEDDAKRQDPIFCKKSCDSKAI